MKEERLTPERKIHNPVLKVEMDHGLFSEWTEVSFEDQKRLCLVHQYL